MGKLSRLLEGDTGALHELADTILADVALTQRLRRLANTIPYRQGPQPVTTVTRAIMLLGFNHVRAAAMSLVLVDAVMRNGDGACIHDEFRRALFAGALAREMLASTDAQQAEEASIAAMFRHVGRLLVAVFGPRLLARLRPRDASVSEAAAARRMLGCSFEELTERVLRMWALPERIKAAAAPVAARISAPRSAADRVCVAAQFADAIGGVLAEAQGEAALARVLAQFAPAFAPDRAALQKMFDAAAARTRQFETACGLAPHAVPQARRRDESLPRDGQAAALAQAAGAMREALSVLQNARRILLAALNDASESLALGADPGHVIRIVLEAIRAGLGFGRAALVARGPGDGMYRALVSVGSPRPPFAFSPAGATHLSPRRWRTRLICIFQTSRRTRCARRCRRGSRATSLKREVLCCCRCRYLARRRVFSLPIGPSSIRKVLHSRSQACCELCEITQCWRCGRHRTVRRASA